MGVASDSHLVRDERGHLDIAPDVVWRVHLPSRAAQEACSLCASVRRQRATSFRAARATPVTDYAQCEGGGLAVYCLERPMYKAIKDRCSGEEWRQ